MPKLRKNWGVVETLHQRELLLFKSPYRTNLKTLKSIITSERKYFAQVWKTTKQKSIVYSDRRLFTESYKKCFALCGYNILPSFMYDLQSSKYGKIEDNLFCCLTAIQPRFENAATYKGSLFTLSSTNWLCNYDIDTGKILESVYLGPPSRFNYKHLDWERQGETITVTSVKNPLRRTTASSNVLVAVAWFSIRPLKFKALLEFDKKVFGRDCVHCNVSEGLLIVGTGTSATGNVLMYDFYRVVKESILFHCGIGETCSALDGAELGSYPAGIPINCKVKEVPPVLFQVKCSEYTLHFGCFPFHFVFSIPKYPETFQVSDVAQETMVENGKISIANTSFDKCHISFHGDDSGRILHYSNTAVRFFKLAEEQNGLRRLHESFKIDLEKSTAIPKKTKIVPSSNRPARQSKKKMDSDFASDCDRVFLCDDYENEVDIFAVLFVTRNVEKPVVTLDLYDNNTEMKIKSIKTSIKYDEFSEYDLTLDLDTVLIIEKTSQNQYGCYIFQIQESVEEKTRTAVQLKKKR